MRENFQRKKWCTRQNAPKIDQEFLCFGAGGKFPINENGKGSK